MTVAKGAVARNITLVVELSSLYSAGQNVLDTLVISVAINGIQSRCWTKLSIGPFALRIDYPVFSLHYPSVMSITIAVNSFGSIAAEIFESIRFSHVKIVEEVVFSFDRFGNMPIALAPWISEAKSRP